MSDPMVELERVTDPMTELEYEDLFADMGIGRGLTEYERGKAMLVDMGLDEIQYEQAVKGLADWCEV